MKINPGYLRVSLLSACNLRCSYCMPEGQERQRIVAPAEKVRSAIRFLRRQGVRKIRFTGGEPTLSKDLSGLIAFVKGLHADVHTAITSNGVLLESKARQLAKVGLDSANISIDTLDRRKFRDLTGRDDLRRVIAGIESAAEYFEKVKLNCVLIRGFNDDETARLILFADRLGIDIRFIEFMPNFYSAPGDPRFISGKEIRNCLPWEFEPISGSANSAARYYTSPSLRIKVGYISSVSHPFCSACDRIRLTAGGNLHNCLYDSKSINLFNLLESGSDRVAVEYKKFIESKQFGRYRKSAESSTALPSFIAIGG